MEEDIMERPTRRRFLKQVAAVGGAMVLRPLDVVALDEGLKKVPQMSICRWDSDAAPDTEIDALAEKLTENAIATLGGMDRFVKKGDVVWIKPNMGWNRTPELGANTNPHVVSALARLCFEAGAKKVKIGDNTCHNAKQCYPRSGIAAAAKDAGAEIVYLDERRFREVDLKGKRLTTWPVYPEIIEADLVINVPIVKHHGLSRVSLCMKNYMGIVGGQRNAWHQDLPTCLVDITAYMKPRLCVLDAVRVLTNHGPQGGNTADVKRLDTVAAGTDIVALDAFGAELLGHEPGTIETVRAGHEAGLGEIDYRKLSLREVVVS
jgi:uncharacterized protein (DUF362 family)